MSRHRPASGQLVLIFVETAPAPVVAPAPALVAPPRPAPLPEDRPARNRELAARMKAGDAEARRMLVEENLPLGVEMARRYLSRRRIAYTFDELASYAGMALAEAVDRFDPDRSGFSTFASRSVLWSMDRQVRERHLIAPPRVRERGEPKSMVSGDSVDWHVLGLAADDPGPAVDDVDETAARARLVDRLLSGSDERSRQVVASYYGLGGGEPTTLDAVGRRFGISRERVRQIVESTLEDARSVAVRCSPVMVT